MTNRVRNVILVLVSLGIVAAGIGGVFLLKSVFSAPKDIVMGEIAETEAPSAAPKGDDASVAATAPPFVLSDGDVKNMVGSMTLEEKIGQMFFVDFSLLGGGGATDADDRTLRLVKEYNIGGVVFRKQNLVNKEQVVRFTDSLQRNSKYPMFIALEEELGAASVLDQIEAMDAKGTPDMSKMSREDSKKAGVTMAGNLSALGFNMELGPDVDVYIDGIANEYLAGRTFGSDADKTASMAADVISGLQSSGVAAVAKFFPGMGGASATEADMFPASMRTLTQLRQAELAPYKKAIEAGVDVIMVSDMQLPLVEKEELPCSVSPLIMQDLLRGEMGYQGVVMTAPLNDKAITQRYGVGEAVTNAVKAGADILYMPSSLEAAFIALQSAVKNGDITEDRINESVARILAVKIQKKWLNVEDYGPFATPEPTRKPHQESWSENEDSGEGENWSEEDGSGDEGGSYEDWSEDSSGESSGGESSGGEDSSGESSGGEDSSDEDSGGESSGGEGESSGSEGEDSGSEGEDSGSGEDEGSGE